MAHDIPPGIWNRTAMIRRNNIKLQHLMETRLQQLVNFGARFVQQSHGDLTTEVQNRAELLAKVPAKSREMFPDASETAYKALYGAFAERYAISNRETKAVLKALSS